MDVTIQNLLSQYSPELRLAIATIIRYTQELDPETRRLVLCHLEGTNPCTCPRATRTCGGCHQPHSRNCCKIRDVTIEISCPDCGQETLA